MLKNNPVTIGTRFLDRQKTNPSCGGHRIRRKTIQISQMVPKVKRKKKIKKKKNKCNVRYS